MTMKALVYHGPGQKAWEGDQDAEADRRPLEDRNHDHVQLVGFPQP
jgi:hypothetical protein